VAVTCALGTYCARYGRRRRSTAIERVRTGGWSQKASVRSPSTAVARLRHWTQLTRFVHSPSNSSTSWTARFRGRKNRFFRPCECLTQWKVIMHVTTTYHQRFRPTQWRRRSDDGIQRNLQSVAQIAWNVKMKCWNDKMYACWCSQTHWNKL